MRISCVLESTVKDIVEYFKPAMGEELKSTKLDNNTTIISFKDNILIVNLDIIERIIHVGTFSLFTLSIDIIINGKLILQKQLEGDDCIVMAMCQNIKYNLDNLLEGKHNECIRTSTQKEVAV